VRYDAGIEQCRGFERIFVEKIGADQLALNFGKTAVSRQGFFHFVGAGFECRQQVAMAAKEILQNVGELTGRDVGIECENPFDDMIGACPVGRLRSRGSVAGLNGRTITRAGRDEDRAPAGSGKWVATR